jgi:hypothetical protein
MVRLHRPRPPRPAPWLLALFGLATSTLVLAAWPRMWREARGEWAGRRIRFFTQQQLAAAGFLGRGCLDLRPSSAMTTRPRTRTFSATLAVYICDFFIMFGIEAISVGKIVGQNGQAAAQEILLCWLAADAGLAPPPAPAPSTWRGWRYGCS